MLGYFLALFPLYLIFQGPINQHLLINTGLITPSSPYYHLISPSSSSFTTSSSTNANDAPFEFDFTKSILVPPPDINETNGELSDPRCREHSYRVHILSRDPLVLYLENFVSEEERADLVALSEPLFRNSTVYSSSSSPPPSNTDEYADDDEVETTNHQPHLAVNPQIRNSLTATPPRLPHPADPRSQNTIQCIERRALALQGWRPHLYLEKLRTQKYGPGGHYVHHFDWSGGSVGVVGKGRDEGRLGRMERVSSFLAYIVADGELVGGGTEFPRLRSPRWRLDGGGGERWCGWIVCPPVVEEEEGEDGGGDDDGAVKGGELRQKAMGAKGKKMKVRRDKGDEFGVTFKPVAGNAIFWENLREDGSGYEETWHSGLPVEKGTKIGLNIWGWRVYGGR